MATTQGTIFPGPVDPVLDLFNPPSVFDDAVAPAVALLNIDADSPQLVATKKVLPPYFEGSQVSYEIVISNIGNGAQPDNPGDEFTDVLPVQLQLKSVTASNGIASANILTNTASWNGPLPAAGSVTITITADILALEGTQISNQAQIAFDPDEDGSNDTIGVTDNPDTADPDDSSVFTVAKLLEVPMLSPFALLLLVLLLVSTGWRRYARR